MYSNIGETKLKSEMCSIVGCDSWRRNSRRYTLPEDPEKKLEWIQFVLEVNNMRLKESSCTDVGICSEHFTSDCFIYPRSASGTVQLKCGAVPTVNVKEEPEEELELKQEPVEIEAAAFCCEQLKRSDSPGPIIEKVMGNMDASAIWGSNDYSDSSMSDTILMLRKIKNLDMIREKAALLEKERRYVINEKQIFQLFSSKCPSCQSKVKMKKVVHGVHLALILECPQCDYRKQWKNLSDAGIPAAEYLDVEEYIEVSLEKNDGQSSNRGNPKISDISSDQEEEEEENDDDSDDNWLPEEEQLLYEALQSESDEESSNDDLFPKNPQLCTDCGNFYDGRKQHTCVHKLKPYSCNICGKRCVNEAALANHSRVHDENYRYPCKYCHASFKTKMEKIAHEQTHEAEEKPYRCSDCSETFANNIKRGIHMLEHRGPAKYECHVCGLAFPRALPYKRHLLVHTGEKPYKCPVCQRGFNQAGHLKSHMRLHTGEKPFQCQCCDKSFRHNVSLKSHVQRYHKPNSKSGATGKRNEGTDENEGTAGSGFDEEEQVQVKRKPKYKKKSTGRPIGRPRRNPDADTRTAKVKGRKSKRKLPSSEESKESFDLTEEEDDRSVQRSGRGAKGSDSGSDFEAGMKKRRSKNVSKGTGGARKTERVGELGGN